MRITATMFQAIESARKNGGRLRLYDFGHWAGDDGIGGEDAPYTKTIEALVQYGLARYTAWRHVKPSICRRKKQPIEVALITSACDGIRQGKWPRTPFEVRFWHKVNKTETCWLWTGHTNYSGYGLFRRSRGSQEVRAHRVSWDLHYGQVPEGLLVLHKCDVRNCVNPDHLFLGTQPDNVRDCEVKGRAWHQTLDTNEVLKKAWTTRRRKGHV